MRPKWPRELNLLSKHPNGPAKAPRAQAGNRASAHFSLFRYAKLGAFPGIKGTPGCVLKRANKPVVSLRESRAKHVGSLIGIPRQLQASPFKNGPFTSEQLFISCSARLRRHQLDARRITTREGQRGATQREPRKSALTLIRGLKHLC